MTILKGYTGTTIKQHGVRGINCFWDGKPFRLLFHIVDIEGHNLLGLPTMIKMGFFTDHKFGECGDSRHSCRVQEPGQV